MTRFAIDYLTAIRIVRDGVVVHPDHQLVAPNLLRSEALSHVYRGVRAGEMAADEGRRILDGITTMRIRSLGDRVSRATAWKVAEQLDWDDTGRAEYLAVAKLQADFLVTLDEELAKAAAGIVEVAPFEALARA